MQISNSICSCSSSCFNRCNHQRDPNSCVDSADTITFKFDQSLGLDDDKEEFVDCEKCENDDNDFTFTSDRLTKNNPVFPLFDLNLLSEIPSSEYDEIENIAVGPYCTWSKRNVTESREFKKKSNSTGFSKLWRLRDKFKRSNSDGVDAFVFLKGSLKSVVVDRKPKVVKKGTKGQTSAHEVYLKKREEDRRRCYLPYRPEIMGFFTNVNGGLSRNVHTY